MRRIRNRKKAQEHWDKVKVIQSNNSIRFRGGNLDSFGSIRADLGCEISEMGQITKLAKKTTCQIV